MKPSNLSATVLPFVIAFVLGGCKKEAPPGTIDEQSQGSSGIELSVTAEPNPEGGVMIAALARNKGSETFRYTATCGRADMSFRFFDENGDEVQVTNPCEPVPMMGCPSALGIPIGPGQTAASQHWFSGSTWDGCSGTTAPAGVYKVTVSFPFYQDIDVGQDEVTSTATFRWEP